MKPKIAGVLLAAGESRRLQTPKQLLFFQGDYLIKHTIQTIRDGGIAEIFVVLGANASQIHPILTNTHVNIIINQNWIKGLHTSISAGVSAVRRMNVFDGVVIFVVDQPFLRPAFIKKQIEFFSTFDKPIVAPSFQQKQINPVLFSKEFFPGLEKLQAGQSGKTIIAQEDVYMIDVEDQLMALDIDTEDDYNTVLSYSSSSDSKL